MIQTKKMALVVPPRTMHPVKTMTMSKPPLVRATVTVLTQPTVTVPSATPEPCTAKMIAPWRCPAHLAGMVLGDVITHVGGVAVTGLNELKGHAPRSSVTRLLYEA